MGCIAVPVSGVPPCSRYLFWYDLGGTSMTLLMPSRQHAAARFQTRLNNGSGLSGTFQHRSDASLVKHPPLHSSSRPGTESLYRRSCECNRLISTTILPYHICVNEWTAKKAAILGLIFSGTSVVFLFAMEVAMSWQPGSGSQRIGEWCLASLSRRGRVRRTTLQKRNAWTPPSSSYHRRKAQADRGRDRPALGRR